MLKPAGFWSYHRPDGQRSGTWLPGLHRMLVSELENRIGTRHDVAIFRDETMHTGTAWEAELNNQIDAASFLVAIVRPGFLQSAWCCHEVNRFLAREATLNRGGLIFPLHFIDVDAFQDCRLHECPDPSVTRLLFQRQMKDFRRLRREDVTDRAARHAIFEIAEAIHDALDRPAIAAVPAAPSSAATVAPVLVASAAAAPSADAAPSPAPSPVAPRAPPAAEPAARVSEPAPALPGAAPASSTLPPAPAPRGPVMVGGGCYAYLKDKDGKWSWQQSPDRDWQHPGFEQRDDEPVVCVNHDDAVAHADWLRQKTGKDYRLPTEAEWEYAARAGTTTARFWGDDRASACEHANVSDATLRTKLGNPADPERYFACTDDYAFTSPVGRFGTNPWGLADMLGNVWQWTADCYHDSYQGAPADGSAWTTKDCGRWVLRGASWFDYPWNLRVGVRNRAGTALRSGAVGFRLARTL